MTFLNDSIIYIDSDNIIKLVGLKNNDTGAFINTATVTLTILNLLGVEVSGDTWPATMAYTAASNGEYKYITPSTLVLSEDILYQAKITAVDGSNNAIIWKDIRALNFTLP